MLCLSCKRRVLSTVALLLALLSNVGTVNGSKSNGSKVEAWDEFEEDQKVTAIFNKFDVDMNGFLSRDEMNHLRTTIGKSELDMIQFHDMCTEMGADMSKGIIKDQLLSAERRGTSNISYGYPVIFPWSKEEDAMLVASFSKFDADMNGYLDLDEFNNWQIAVGEETITMDIFVQICEVLGARPNALSQKALRTGMRERMGSIRHDYQWIFPWPEHKEQELVALFTRFDTDKNGFLSLSEMNAWQNATHEAKLDSNTYEVILKMLGGDPDKGFRIDDIRKDLREDQAHINQIDHDYDTVIGGKAPKAPSSLYDAQVLLFRNIYTHRLFLVTGAAMFVVGAVAFMAVRRPETLQCFTRPDFSELPMHEESYTAMRVATVSAI